MKHEKKSISLKLKSQPPEALVAAQIQDQYLHSKQQNPASQHNNSSKLQTQKMQQHESPAQQSPRRVAVVTGAGSGIGRAAALQLALLAHYYSVIVVADVDGAAAEAAAAGIRAAAAASPGLVVAAVTCDVGDEEAVASLAKEAARLSGGGGGGGSVHAVLANAGVEGARAAIEAFPIAAFDAVMRVNVRGAFLTLKHFAPLLVAGAAELRAAGDARATTAAVVTSSTAGLSGMPEFSAYSISKHALLGLVRTAAAELAPRGVRVNALCPATTATPMVERFEQRWPEWQQRTNASYPLGRIASAEEVGRAAVWLCDGAGGAGFMTGQQLVLDGGALCS